MSKDLNITVTPDDIISAFRMKAGPRDKIRPVMVKFKTSQIRDSVMGAKKNLRLNNKPIYFSDHLTRAAGELFFSARGWSSNEKFMPPGPLTVRSS